MRSFTKIEIRSIGFLFGTLLLSVACSLPSPSHTSQRKFQPSVPVLEEAPAYGLVVLQDHRIADYWRRALPLGEPRGKSNTPIREFAKRWKSELGASAVIEESQLVYELGQATGRLHRSVCSETQARTKGSYNRMLWAVVGEGRGAVVAQMLVERLQKVPCSSDTWSKDRSGESLFLGPLPFLLLLDQPIQRRSEYGGAWPKASSVAVHTVLSQRESLAGCSQDQIGLFDHLDLPEERRMLWGVRTESPSMESRFSSVLSRYEEVAEQALADVVYLANPARFSPNSSGLSFSHQARSYNAQLREQGFFIADTSAFITEQRVGELTRGMRSSYEPLKVLSDRTGQSLRSAEFGVPFHTGRLADVTQGEEGAATRDLSPSESLALFTIGAWHVDLKRSSEIDFLLFGQFAKHVGSRLVEIESLEIPFNQAIERGLFHTDPVFLICHSNTGGPGVIHLGPNQEALLNQEISALSEEDFVSKLMLPNLKNGGADEAEPFSKEAFLEEHSLKFGHTLCFLGNGGPVEADLLGRHVPAALVHGSPFRYTTSRSFVTTIWSFESFVPGYYNSLF